MAVLCDFGLCDVVWCEDVLRIGVMLYCVTVCCECLVRVGVLCKDVWCTVVPCEAFLCEVVL